MSSAQRQTRRRTTRHLFDDDEEPPAKRSRIETVPITNGASKQPAAKSAGLKTKRTKPSYDEDADGFTFARKTRTKKVVDEPVPVQASQPSSTKPRAAKPRQDDGSSRATATSTSSDVEGVQKKRRSARLSGDKEEVVQILPDTRPKRKRKSDEPVPIDSNSTKSPQLPQQEIVIPKNRGGTKIALPFADTPVINRNKEMRAGKTKTQNRRSSVNSRGRRASSLIESGTSNALPHAEVEVKDFYKHIEHSLIEPKRMKQLLTWSAERALPTKTHGTHSNPAEAFTDEAARQIIEDLLKDFATKNEMSDWFCRPDTPEAESSAAAVAIVKRPNPRNKANMERLKSLEEEIGRLKEEELAWTDLLKPPPRAESPSLDTIDTEALDPSQAALLAELGIEPSIRDSSDITSRMQTINQNLEPQIDLFADGIHKVTQYRLAAERVADTILSTTARKLEIREKSAAGAMSNRPAVEGRDVLSALAGAMLTSRR